MIVDPDFCDHWKTRMLVGLLNDEAAPVYVLRIWAHCQNRRCSTFDSLPAEALKSLCRFPGQANKLESSLAASGFIRRDGQSLEVIGWDEYNSSLIAAWRNGKKGGRPVKKKPSDNPRVNPEETHGLTQGITQSETGFESAKPSAEKSTPPGDEKPNDSVDEKPTGLRLDRIGLDIPPNPQGLKGWGELRVPEPYVSSDRFMGQLQKYATLQGSKGNYNPIAFQDLIEKLASYPERKAFAYLRYWTTSNRWMPKFDAGYEDYLPRDDDQPANRERAPREYAPRVKLEGI